LGLSQQELCEGICSRSMISHIETGRTKPSIPLLQQLCKRLGVSVAEIVDENVLWDAKDGEWMENIVELYAYKEYEAVFRLSQQIYNQARKRQDSTHLMALLYMGYALFQQLKIQDAKTCFQTGLDLAKTNKWVTNQILFQNGLGSCYGILGDMEQALHLYRTSYQMIQTVNLEPRHTIKLICNMANVTIATHDFKSSLRFVQDALGLSKRFSCYEMAGDIHNILDFHHLRHHRFEEARNQFSKAYHFNSFLEEPKEIAGNPPQPGGSFLLQQGFGGCKHVFGAGAPSHHPPFSRAAPIG
jgi:tetratricopeptide (TPR) repeat protein